MYALPRNRKYLHSFGDLRVRMRNHYAGTLLGIPLRVLSTSKAGTPNSAPNPKTISTIVFPPTPPPFPRQISFAKNIGESSTICWPPLIFRCTINVPKLVFVSRAYTRGPFNNSKQTNRSGGETVNFYKTKFFLLN